MSRTARTKRGCLRAVVVLAAVAALVPIQTIRWSGGFSNTEFRLTFTDTSGRPVPGVTLRVETQAGGVCHLYPVDEFLPDSTPTSDADGRMVFHNASRIIWGGRVDRSLLGVEYGEFRGPQYTCVCLLAGREVHRVKYRDLDRSEVTHPPLTRMWKDPDWPSREWVASEGEWESLRVRLFDGNRDGKLDREELTAARYFAQLAEDTHLHKERPVTFHVVERAITITVP